MSLGTHALELLFFHIVAQPAHSISGAENPVIWAPNTTPRRRPLRVGLVGTVLYFIALGVLCWPTCAVQNAGHVRRTVRASSEGERRK